MPPRWLDVTTLNTVIDSERSDDVFQVRATRLFFFWRTRAVSFAYLQISLLLAQALPFHYIELATDLCKYAREDLQDWSLSYDLMVLIRLLIDFRGITTHKQPNQTTG